LALQLLLLEKVADSKAEISSLQQRSTSHSTTSKRAPTRQNHCIWNQILILPPKQKPSKTSIFLTKEAPHNLML
jgi:hypothetical protein